MKSNEELAIEYQKTGSMDAAEQLYLQNSGLIEKFIRRYSGIEELDDLRQESFFGLVKAAERWKPERGSAFSTYAVFWIRAAIISYLRKREPAAVSLSAPIGGEDDDRALEDTLAAAGTSTRAAASVSSESG